MLLYTNIIGRVMQNTKASSIPKFHRRTLLNSLAAGGAWELLGGMRSSRQNRSGKTAQPELSDFSERDGDERDGDKARRRQTGRSRRQLQIGNENARASCAKDGY